MSSKTDRPERGRYDAARKMVSALCQPRGSAEARSWIMSIPARPDQDPDLVISASLADVPKLLEEIDWLLFALAANDSLLRDIRHRDARWHDDELVRRVLERNSELLKGDRPSWLAPATGERNSNVIEDASRKEKPHG